MLLPIAIHIIACEMKYTKRGISLICRKSTASVEQEIYCVSAPHFPENIGKTHTTRINRFILLTINNGHSLHNTLHLRANCYLEKNQHQNNLIDELTGHRLLDTPPRKYMNE